MEVSTRRRMLVLALLTWLCGSPAGVAHAAGPFTPASCVNDASADQRVGDAR